MHPIRIALVIVVLASVACVCGSTGSTRDPDGITTITGVGTEAPAGATAELPMGAVGERVESGGMALTVSSVEVMTAVDEFFTAEEGNVFVVADVTIENTGRDKVDYNPFYFQVKDSDGFEYTGSLFAPDPSMKSGELAEGDKARGNVAFQVAEGASGLIMSYEPIVFFDDYQLIQFNLGDAVLP